MKWAVLLLAVIAAGIGSFFAYRTISKRRDLHETLSWMDQTYNPHEGGDNLGHGRGWEIHYLQKGNTEEETERFGMTFAQDGNCSVIIRSETFPVGVFSETPSVQTDQFSLGDIDPNSIRVKTYDLRKDVFSCADPEEVKLYQLNCDSAEIEFRTRNGLATISENTTTTYTRLTGKDHELRKISKANKAWLIVNDVPYAVRLAKAFKHAVKLCGGQPSKF